MPPDGTCTLAGTQVDGTISVGGGVRIVQGSSATVDQVVVTGDLHLEANQRALSATRNRVGGSLQAIGNQAGVVVRSNMVEGAVQCRQNLFLPLAGDNQAASLEEQCASLATRMFLPAITVGQYPLPARPSLNLLTYQQ